MLEIKGVCICNHLAAGENIVPGMGGNSTGDWLRRTLRFGRTEVNEKTTSKDTGLSVPGIISEAVDKDCMFEHNILSTRKGRLTNAPT